MTETTRLCSVEGCEKPSRIKGPGGYCGMHYVRLRNTGTTEATRRWHRRGSCSIEGCAAPERNDGVCNKHWWRLRRYGNPDTVLPVRALGEENLAWKGDDAAYGTAHIRVRKARGPATLFTCVDCGAQARHWSYDHADPNEKQSGLGRPYSTDTTHYEPRCVPCHKRFDLDAIRKGEDG